jgi:hypothetical protein
MIDIIQHEVLKAHIEKTGYSCTMKTLYELIDLKFLDDNSYETSNLITDINYRGLWEVYVYENYSKQFSVK